MHHYFNTEIAKEVGVNAAVILENIAHWVLRNKANDSKQADNLIPNYPQEKNLTLFSHQKIRQANTKGFLKKL